ACIHYSGATIDTVGDESGPRGGRLTGCGFREEVGRDGGLRLLLVFGAELSEFMEEKNGTKRGCSPSFRKL
ncbi:hypothetical protein Tco_0032648, partial [Tanacetum coccineum]